MTSPFKAAKRQNRKLRVAFDGPSGSGKTYTALRLAFSLKAAGMASKICAIDTENESISLYAGEAPDGEPWEFDVLNLKQFSPSQYTFALKEAVKAGYDCVVVDSLSHAWIGAGGALDMVDEKSRGGGNSFTAWKDITPLQREMVDTIIRLPAHVIVTMRSKTEYVMVEEQNKKGELVKVPKKIGMAPVQRDGLEYEFDLYGCIDQTNQMRVSKTRCSLMNGKTIDKPGPQFWQPMFDWMNGAVVDELTVIETAATSTKSQLEESEAETVARWKAIIDATADRDDLKKNDAAMVDETSRLSNDGKTKIREAYRAKLKTFPTAAATPVAPSGPPTTEPATATASV